MLAERGEPAEGADARQGHLGVVVEAERSVGVAVSRLHELAIFVVHQLRWLRRRHSDREPLARRSPRRDGIRANLENRRD